MSLQLLSGEVCRTSKKKITIIMITMKRLMLALRAELLQSRAWKVVPTLSQLSVRLTRRVLRGALTSIFFAEFFLARATNFAEKDRLLLVHAIYGLQIFLVAPSTTTTYLLFLTVFTTQTGLNSRSSHLSLSCSLTSTRSRLRQRSSDRSPPDAEDLMTEM